MRITWFGMSAFHLQADGKSVFIDPIGQMPASRRAHISIDYPPIPRLDVDLLLVTHEHWDHSGRDALGEVRHAVAATAGRFETPIGEVLAVASEHDQAAGTQRGPNTIFRFDLGGLRVCHFGDFGQAGLRPEQAAAIGQVDLLFVPVGGGPTVDADGAFAICGALSPRIVVPMHYRTPLVSFLDPPQAFLEKFVHVEKVGTTFETPAREGAGQVVLVPATPGA